MTKDKMIIDGEYCAMIYGDVLVCGKCERSPKYNLYSNDIKLSKHGVFLKIEFNCANGHKNYVLV